MKLEVTSLTGNCNIYFSSLSKYPNSSDNETKITIVNDDITSLHTKIYKKNMKIFKNRKSIYAHMYLTIEGV